MILLFKSPVKGKGLYVQCFQSWYSIFSISPCPALIHTLLMYFLHTLSMCTDNGSQHRVCSVHFIIIENEGFQFEYIFLKLIAWAST